MQNRFTLGVIGAGNMATAIIGGILASKLLSPDKIVISDTDESKLESFKTKGLVTTSDNAFAANNCDYLLFAVKPQTAQNVFDQIKDCLTAENIISIMAGVSIGRLESVFGKRNYSRIMPNTPALVGEGMSAVAFSNGYHSEFVLNVFGTLGKVVELNEALFDAVTSLSGSGPAYVYMFIKALIDGGIKGGLPYDTAKLLAVQTVTGAAKMIEKSDKPIDELIDAVCSKGGTTIQAVESFRNDKLEEAVIRGMDKCRLRSVELGKQK